MDDHVEQSKFSRGVGGSASRRDVGDDGGVSLRGSVAPGEVILLKFSFISSLQSLLVSRWLSRKSQELIGTTMTESLRLLFPSAPPEGSRHTEVTRRVRHATGHYCLTRGEMTTFANSSKSRA